MKRIVIIEGVAGAGKSTIVREIESWFDSAQERGRLKVFLEDETVGDIVSLVSDPGWQEHPHFETLDRVIRELEDEFTGSPEKLFLIERFHLTSFALFPRWELVQKYDAQLANLGAVHVLLTFPDGLVEERSIERPELRAAGWSEGMDRWYGSRAAAIDAATKSQRGRWEGIRRSALPFLHLDTREKDWSRYVRTIMKFWGHHHGFAQPGTSTIQERT